MEKSIKRKKHLKLRLYKPNAEIVAIKKIDLEGVSLNNFEETETVIQSID